MMSSRHVRTSM
jgi:hypothetical protein